MNRGQPAVSASQSTGQPRVGLTAVRLAAALAVLGALLLLAGLAVGSEGFSLAWGDDAALIASIRAPRSLGALAAGALLGLAGALAQGLFRNPLADPYLLGAAAVPAWAWWPCWRSAGG